MPDADVVRRTERLRDLPDQRRRLLERHAACGDGAAQRLALDVLHDEELFAVGRLPGVEHADHAGMVDARERLHLLEELLAHPGVFVHLLEEHFDDDALGEELAVLGEIHGAHPAPPERPFDLVAVFKDLCRRLAHGS